MDVLGEPVGKQDPYVAAHGGICAYTFDPRRKVEVEPLELDPEVLRRMRDQLLLFYTGEARSASNMLADQDTRSKAGDEEMLENLHRTKELGLSSRELLATGDLEEYAELMHEHWEHKRRRSPGMSDERIDRLYTLARRSGVIGGKLVGAGGGGFLLVYARARRTPGRRWRRRAPPSSRSTSSSAAPTPASTRERRPDPSRHFHRSPSSPEDWGPAWVIPRARPKAAGRGRGRALSSHELRRLADHGAGEEVLCVGHLGERIEASVGDGALRDALPLQLRR